MSESYSVNGLPWGNQTQAVVNMSSASTPPIYLRGFLEHSQDFWGGFRTRLEKNFFCVRNFCRPPETPLWGQRGPSQGKKWSKISREI